MNLSGTVAFIAGVSDSRGYGWAICKHLAEAGAKVLVGTWPPAMRPFVKKLSRKDGFGSEQLTPSGRRFTIDKVYALDVSFSTPSEVPPNLADDRHYAGLGPFDIQSVVEAVRDDVGRLDFLVHAVANSPSPSSPLLSVSRQDYLATASASSYSFVACAQRFGPILSPGGAMLCLTYAAGRGAVPGYGGGLSSAKAQLEADTRTLAWECGRRWGVRVNAVSAGPLRSRAAAAIGRLPAPPAPSSAPGADGSGASGGAESGAEDRPFIDCAIDYMRANAPLARPLSADDVGAASLFLLSPMARAVTGVTLHVDNGLHAMAVATDSRSFPAPPPLSVPGDGGAGAGA